MHSMLTITNCEIVKTTRDPGQLVQLVQLVLHKFMNRLAGGLLESRGLLKCFRGWWLIREGVVGGQNIQELYLSFRTYQKLPEAIYSKKHQ